MYAYTVIRGAIARLFPKKIKLVRWRVDHVPPAEIDANFLLYRCYFVSEVGGRRRCKLYRWEMSGECPLRLGDVLTETDGSLPSYHRFNEIIYLANRNLTPALHESHT